MTFTIDYIHIALFTGWTGDSQVSGNRQHRINQDRAVQLVQYLTIGKLLILAGLTLGLRTRCRGMKTL